MELTQERLVRRRWTCLSLAVAVIAAGLVWRLVPLGMPGLWVKYGGSVLWAAMVYLLVAAARPGWRPARVAVVAGVVAAAVEFFKLVHAPGLDAFRGTLTGRLLLGREFGWWDIAAYWVAIAVCGAGDGWRGKNAIHSESVASGERAYPRG